MQDAAEGQILYNSSVNHCLLPPTTMRPSLYTKSGDGFWFLAASHTIRGSDHTMGSGRMDLQPQVLSPSTAPLDHQLLQGTKSLPDHRVNYNDLYATTAPRESYLCRPWFATVSRSRRRGVHTLSAFELRISCSRSRVHNAPWANCRYARSNNCS
jgi:hypothetical protein